MTTQEMSQRNEAPLIEKVRTEFSQGHLFEAMKLCQDFMGIDAKEAYTRVKMLCEDTGQKGEPK